MRFRTIAVALVALLALGCATLDEAEPEESEQLQEQPTAIYGGALVGEGIPPEAICEYYDLDVLTPALQGMPDDDVREGLEEILVEDAPFMEDMPTNRMLYDMLVDLAEAWDAGDEVGIAEASERLNVRCAIELS